MLVASKKDAESSCMWILNRKSCACENFRHLFGEHAHKLCLTHSRLVSHKSSCFFEKHPLLLSREMHICFGIGPAVEKRGA